MTVDTDDLSDFAYTIIVGAAGFSDTLKAELGSMCSSCQNENDWLHAVQRHLRKILANPGEYLEFWNLEEEEGISGEEFSRHTRSLLKQTELALDLPLGERKQIS